MVCIRVRIHHVYEHGGGAHASTVVPRPSSLHRKRPGNEAMHAAAHTYTYIDIYTHTARASLCCSGELKHVAALVQNEQIADSGLRIIHCWMMMMPD